MAKKKTVKKKKIVSSKTKKSLPKSVDMHYLKTNNYRTYHVDGIFGGLTPDGNKLYIELFVQRVVTPTKVKHAINQDGTLGKEIGKREGKSGIIREIESGIIMDINVVRTFKKWLEEKINQHENINTNLKPKK